MRGAVVSPALPPQPISRTPAWPAVAQAGCQTVQTSAGWQPGPPPPVAPPPPSFRVRPPQPADLPALKSLHEALFPLDYDDSFYRQSTHAENNVFGWVATVDAGSSGEKVVGFVFARLCLVRDCEAADRRLLGFTSMLQASTVSEHLF